MGGGISVESTPGVGSTFTFTVAVAPATGPVRVVLRRTESTFDTELAQRYPLRILLAEDMAVNQKIVVAMLQRLGYRPDVVANGREAVDAVQRRAYDVVLMDVRMPEMDGLEAARRITEMMPAAQQPRIVALTANAMLEDRHAGAAAGMADYLAKPFRPAELRTVLERCGEWVKHRSQQAAESGGGPCAALARLAEDAEACLDPARWEELRGSDPAEYQALVASLLELFQAEIPPLLQTIGTAAGASDARALSRAAHGVKGCAANLGATRLAELSARLEKSGRAGQCESATALLAELEQEYARVCDAMRAQMGAP